MREVRIQLPDYVAQAAEDAGLLEPEGIAALIREKLRADALDRIKANWERTSDEPPMSMEDITQEVRAVRAERRRAAGS